MPEYKNVGTPGHIDYAAVNRERNGQVIIIDETGMRYADTSDLISICPTGHEAFYSGLKTPPVTQLQNRETWRGKGKRRMPKGGR